MISDAASHMSQFVLHEQILITCLFQNLRKLAHHIPLVCAQIAPNKKHAARIERREPSLTLEMCKDAWSSYCDADQLFCAALLVGTTTRVAMQL